MFPVAFPNGSILLGWWDSQKASARGEPGGEQGPPASLSEVPWVLWGSLPGMGAGVTKPCLHLPCWRCLEGFLSLQSCQACHPIVLCPGIAWRVKLHGSEACNEPQIHRACLRQSCLWKPLAGHSGAGRPYCNESWGWLLAWGNEIPWRGNGC